MLSIRVSYFDFSDSIGCDVTTKKTTTLFDHVHGSCTMWVFKKMALSFSTEVGHHLTAAREDEMNATTTTWLSSYLRKFLCLLI